MATATSLEFDKLPLVEAAVRFSFDSALEVDFRAAQAVLDKVTKFDNLDLPSQIEVPPGIENALLVVGPNVPNAFSAPQPGECLRSLGGVGSNPEDDSTQSPAVRRPAVVEHRGQDAPRR